MQIYKKVQTMDPGILKPLPDTCCTLKNRENIEICGT